MRRVLVLTVLAILSVSVVAGCGGTEGSVTRATPTSMTSAQTGGGQTSTPTPTPTSPTATDAATGCASLTKAEVQRYGLYAQVFPQIRGTSTLEAVRRGTFADYTPASFAAILSKMQFLRGRGVPGLGDPGASLDYYAAVNKALESLLAKQSPTPADFAAYTAVVGDIPTSIGKQVPLNAALSEACPDLG